MGSHPSNTRIAPKNIRQFLDLTERATEGGTACFRALKRGDDAFYSFERAKIQKAKNLCRTSGPGGTACPIMEECLRFALDAKQDDGVWGGMEEDERVALRRRENKMEQKRREREAAEREAEAAGQDTLPIPIIELAPKQAAKRRHLVPHQMRA